ncbi:MAG TPA: hypothetical protein PKU80_13730 [Candidatus Limiplasma sp.]|nr:hypothetical protein [Candidatus Limiplasma sp.]
MLTDLDIERSIRAVAKQSGQTPAQVRRNIKEMLDETRACADPKHQEAWALIPHSGEEPTMEDVFRYLAERIAAHQSYS